MRTFGGWWVIGWMALTSMLAPAVALGQTSLYVNPGGAAPGCPAPTGQTYETIQAAIDAAASGDTVLVCPGIVYAETLSVRATAKLAIRSLPVAGTPPPIIDPGGAIGIAVDDSDHVAIGGLHVTNADIGIHVYNSPGTSIASVIIDHTSQEGVLISPGSPGSVVRGSVLTHVGRDAIGLYYSDQCEARDNTISQSGRDGIYATSAAGLKITRNLVTGNAKFGIELAQVSGALVTSNTVNFNDGDGLSLFTGSGSNIVSGNVARANAADGIFTFGTQVLFKRNTLQANGVFDAEDATKGDGTGGTANVWAANRCDNTRPRGICSKLATSGTDR